MQAALKSNEGKEEFVIEFLYPENYGTDPGVRSSVHIRVQHWDGDHTHSLGASVEGLWLRTEDLQRLHDGLAGWLALPLAELEPAKLDGEWACVYGDRLWRDIRYKLRERRRRAGSPARTGRSDR
jgi:hypothetical protein